MIELDVSAVNGAPSCHFTPGRSLIFQLRPSARDAAVLDRRHLGRELRRELALGVDAPERAEEIQVDALSTSMCRASADGSSVGSCEKPIDRPGPSAFAGGDRRPRPRSGPAVLRAGQQPSREPARRDHARS